MPCESPIKVWKTRPTKGTPGTKVQVPCGTCFLCRTEQARQWAVRIAHEATLHEENAFITLTYNDRSIPSDNGLRYDDLQRFWKRARKHYGKLSYYACGEYGDKTLRPHYHACVFGHAFTKGRIYIREGATPLWTTIELERAWGLGNVSVGALTFETARYTASYVTKKLANKQQYVRTDEETGELIPLEQPKPFMSRNLARGWWDMWNKGVRDHDMVVIQGRRQKPPKAYDRWLGEVDEKEIEKIKKKRQQAVNLARPTQDQTRARAQSARAHAKSKSKSV